MTARRAALLVAAALLARAGGEARAWCPTTTQRASAPGECANSPTSATPLRWSSLCVGYSLYRAGSPTLDFEDVRQVAADAAGRWHMPVCDMDTGATPYLQLQQIDDTWAPTGYSSRDVNANTVSFNSVWRRDAAHSSGAIAITIVTFDTTTGEILDADVEMNQRDEASNPDGFTFTTGMTAPDSADLPTILTHEFGHLHGISHSMLENAVMWYEAGLGQARRDLTPDDVEAICTTYPEERRPPRRVCNPTPYGGLSVSSSGSKVVGGCAAAPAGSVDHRAPRSRAAWAAATAAGLLAFARRRARRR